MTRIISPSTKPFCTLTHSARPLFSRITNVRSVVVTTLVLGTKRLGPEVRTLVMEDLLPRQEEHVRTLDRLIRAREQHLKQEGLRERIDRKGGRGSAAAD